MPYKNMIIYYWSGTGNSLRVARWAGEAARKNGTEAIIYSLGEAEPEKELPDSEGTLLAMVMPTHGFTAPWPVIRFALRLPRRRHASAVSIATRGGAWPGFYLRGLSASTAFLIAAIMRFKGLHVRGIISVDMPQNWTAVVPGLSDSHNAHFHKRAGAGIISFIDDIQAGRRRLFSWDNLFEFVSGLALLPVSFMYLILGRFFLSKMFFASIQCNACGICVENCPHHAVIMKGWGKGRRPYWTFSCESCGRCINYCPLKAIEAGHSLAVLLYFASGVPVALYMTNYLSRWIPEILRLQNKYILFLLDYPFKLAGIFLCYLFLYYLMKVPVINRLFTYTTGTHWYRRYHMPGVRLKDFRHGGRLAP